eukprot:4378057-Amphidinium_carterae.1
MVPDKLAPHSNRVKRKAANVSMDEPYHQGNMIRSKVLKFHDHIDCSQHSVPSQQFDSEQEQRAHYTTLTWPTMHFISDVVQYNAPVLKHRP